MQTAEPIQGLSRPEAYPFPVDRIEICQTHLSVVFHAGPFAYKVLKPVILPFVDLSSLKRRRAVCDNEIRLNRRLQKSLSCSWISSFMVDATWLICSARLTLLLPTMRRPDCFCRSTPPTEPLFGPRWKQ